MKILFLTNAIRDNFFMVGANHLINYLSVEHQVSVVSTPISIFSVFDIKNSVTRSRWKNVISPGKNWKTSICILPFRISRRFFSTKTSEILGAPLKVFFIGMKFDIVIVDSVELLTQIHKYKYRKIIYRPTDIYQNSSIFYEYLEQTYVKDLNIPVFCMSQYSYTAYRKSDYDVVGFRDNGICSKFIRKCNSLKPSNELKSLNVNDRLKFIYVGALDDRLDINFLRLLAQKKSIDLSIYGLGSSVQLIKDCSVLSSKYHGALKHSQLAQVLCANTVGVLPFNEDKKNASRSPMKFYEYISAGLITVSNKKLSNPLVITASTTYEIDQIVHQIRNMMQSDWKKYDHMCKDQLADVTWDKIAHEIIDTV